MYKLYSRKRFVLSLNRNSADKTSIYIRKFIKTSLIILIALLVMSSILNYINPIYETMCEQKAKALATIITNEKSSEVMKNYKYEEMYSIEKDANGNINMITANISPINEIMSDIANLIQKEFNKTEKTKIKIPLGSFTGNYLLSGFGPDVPISISISGTIDTEMKSEFIAHGINQTLHRVYLEISCTVMILTPIRNIEKDIVNQVLLGEHLIVGNIPSAYYNLEGMENYKDTINLTK